MIKATIIGTTRRRILAINLQWLVPGFFSIFCVLSSFLATGTVAFQLRHGRPARVGVARTNIKLAAKASKEKIGYNDDKMVAENDDVFVTDLARYAIKGFSGDLLDSVLIPGGGVQTFPDDRRYALLKQKNKEKFDEKSPEWLHKENFLCAFSAPELMASFRSHYEIVEEQQENKSDDGVAPKVCIRRLLTLYRRSGEDDNDAASEEKPVLGPIDLNTQSGREALASFFSYESNEDLVCVTKETDGKVNTFQFGNTRAGVKNNPGGDTRTVHIVNRATVREFSNKIGLELNPMRFRPNIVIDGLGPWEEFDWVGRTLRIVPKEEGDNDENASGVQHAAHLRLKVLTKTVRCEGIGIDPLDPKTGKLDMPKLLSENYPEHGPYLGVYASIEVIGAEQGGCSGDIDKLLSVGDTLSLLDEDNVVNLHGLLIGFFSLFCLLPGSSRGVAQGTATGTAAFQPPHERSSWASSARANAHTELSAKGSKPKASYNDDDTMVALLHSHHLLDHKPDNLLLRGGRYKLRGVAFLGRPGVALCIGPPKAHTKFKRALESAMPQKRFKTKDLEITHPEGEFLAMEGFSRAETLGDFRAILASIGREAEFFELTGIEDPNSSSSSPPPPNDQSNEQATGRKCGRRGKNKNRKGRK
ncbi:unnamed protein product [Pseudo-nitzschia multistriata]|uniref:MOSC domain-containing protein n=1 Tax=Pseudo-nitzschia multistriata TaxID=183589 RepID=A0A448ZC76_9STRA|nr:unnamed protein product [Pseudo-nitzschia multistriata]